MFATISFTPVTDLFTNVTSLMTSTFDVIFANPYTATLAGLLIAGPVIGLSINLIKRLKG